ncbi:hypothetical protein [Paraburkholderia bryophila]|uniref:Uncharacterized protein n=1 Tax=Paraburkholderia bryophila TaxID=420952 RepID=A0A7Y9W4H9_9BURK|nr:hypothetical protein [Paraburkholderia bryophila]NYH14049.1 hypothetical protein [Paraburkholderia bryophila]
MSDGEEVFAGRFDALAGRLADASPAPLLVRFNASFEGAGDTSDLAWFFAWTLIGKTGLARRLRLSQPSRQLLPSGQCASSSIC